MAGSADKKNNLNSSETSRKKQIVDTASELFARDGFATTVTHIAEKMGVTKGYIYYYFNSKHEILYQIFRQAMDCFLAGARDVNSSNLPVDQRLKAVIKYHIITICENKAVMTVFMDLRKDLRKEHWQEILICRKEYEQLIQNLIREGVNDGYFLLDNEKLLSYSILGSINWVYVWYKEEGKMSKEQVADLISDYLINGLRRWHNPGAIKLGKTVAEISVGDSASFSKTITDADIYLFAGITKDFNPMYINDEFAGKTEFGRRIVHGGITTSLIATILGNILPGFGTIALNTACSFLSPVYPGDTITATAAVVEIDVEKNRVKISISVINQDGRRVAEGEATVVPPKEEYKRLFAASY